MLFQPPFYTFWRTTEVDSIRAAHRWLRDFLSRHGPYDGVICFSQGCALVSSFLLYHAAETPNAPLPFKAAVFICGGVPLSVLADLGVDVPRAAWDISERSRKQLRRAAASLAEKATDVAGIRAGGGLWDGVGRWGTNRPVSRSNVFGLNFTHFPAKVRIRIPTVHIYGAKDPRYSSAIQLVHSCEPTMRRTFDHKGGHDIPRTTGVSENIAELIRWAAVAAKRF